MARALGGLVIALAVVAVVLGLLVVTRPGVPIATPAPRPSPTPVPIDQELLHRRVTFLLLGTDQNAQRKAAGETPLTDSMIVMSVNATHDQLAMVSVPRDTVDVPLPDGKTWREKLNALYATKGVEALRGALQGLLGTTIDYTILITMDDLPKIVDAFGGVDVVAPEPIIDPTVGLRITAGKHHLDGVQALAYSRSRHTTNDFSRAARQQQVLVALLDRFASPGVKVDIGGLLASLSGLKTDVPDRELPTLAEIARLARGAKVTSVVLQPPAYYQVGSDARGYILLPKLDEIRRFTSPLLSGP